MKKLLLLGIAKLVFKGRRKRLMFKGAKMGFLALKQLRKRARASSKRKLTR